MQRDETGFNQIYSAARQFEEENVMEGILTCRFNEKKIMQTLNIVRKYQCELNLQSADLVEFSENFIEQYATDHNECFRITEKLIRRIGTTITGSMKMFRKFCPVVRRKFNEEGRVVPVLDYSRLTFRKYQGLFFGAEAYKENVKTLIHEIASFFYHLMTTLMVCKDMIRKEEEVFGDFERLKQIFEKSCDEVLHSLNTVLDSFGHVKLVSDEELAERRKNARPMREWLSSEYHAHNLEWMRREAYFYRLASGKQYGLDEVASVLWADNPEWGQQVCSFIPQMDKMNIPFKNSKKAKEQGKKGTYDAREMAYMLKWSGVSTMSADGKTVIGEEKERKFYFYVQENYEGDYLFPTWQVVCRERRFLYERNVTMEDMANNFAKYPNSLSSMV
ncbi:MAG: hypothetical protein IJT98_00355 [Prevotella sp.]|nr:hypothetical protein [Prevotella sp.]